jgi:hypothetical protein
MRLFSWAGGAALAAAAGFGFLAGEAWHRHDPANCVEVRDGTAEISEAPPTLAAAPALPPPQPVEEIDLSCLPRMSYVVQSIEPPLADRTTDTMSRPASFELPASPPEMPSAPLTMPYITDEPAPLPPLGDVPALAPNADNPLFQAVRSYFEEAARLPVAPAEITDKVPLGKPPTSEHPSAVPHRLAPIPAATNPARPKVDTMEVRPGELPRTPTGDPM